MQMKDRYRNIHNTNTHVTVSLLDSDTDEWNDYVNNHPGGSFYHRSEWRDLIEKTFGHECYYYIARNPESVVVGLLPLVRLKSRMFGDFMVSMPYFNYGGAIGDSPSIEQFLMEFAADRAAMLGVGHIEFRDELRRHEYPVRTDKVNMILPLPISAASLWEGFPSKLRSQVRRAKRENPAILCGRNELLDSFYSVFARNMRDLGTPVYNRKFFRNILEIFPGESHILVAMLNDKPVAAGFLVGNGIKMDIPWASTVRDVNHLSINMFLYWEALSYAISLGYRYFDFGRSSFGSGTYRFKQQWGAEPQQLYWHYWLDNSSDIPELNPSNQKYALFIRLWKLLPVPVTRWLGPMIVKNLP